MKFNYRKIASVLASTVLLSSTMGFAAAANYPAPFVVSGHGDGAVIVGANAASPDWTAATALGVELSSRVSGTTATISGNAKSLSSGSDLLYFDQALSTNVDTVSKSNLQNVLADGLFTDEGGTEYKYEQTISIGTSSNNKVTFDDSGGDLDNSEFILAMSDDTSTPVMTLTTTFTNKVVPINASDSIGQTIKLFGKEYTIGSSTSATELVLLGGASETTINVGEKPTVTVAGQTYEVSLNGISSATNPEVSLTVNGESRTFTAGQTKKVGGIDVYVKEIFKTGDNAGYAVVQLGSDRLTFKDGSAVKYGTDNRQIDGTLVSITGGLGAMSKLSISIAAPDSDADYIQSGKSFKDPVFGTVSLDFLGMKNAPQLEVEKDVSTTRTPLGIAIKGDKELGASVKLPGYDSVTIPLQYQGAATNKDGNAISVVEGETLAKKDYFFLTAGDKQYFLRLSELSLRNDGDSSFTLQDVLRGENAKEVTDDTHINQSAGTSTTFTLNDKTFNMTAIDSTHVRITSADYGISGAAKYVEVYPIIELVDGMHVKLAMTKEVTLANITEGTTLTLPSGDYTVPAGNSTISSIKVGAVNYTTTTTAVTDTKRTIKIKPLGEGNVSLMLVEEQDKSEAGSTEVDNAVLLPTVYDGSYAQAKDPVMTATNKVTGKTFDNSDYSASVDAWGSYVLKDASDTDQTVTTLTYNSDGSQMYADVYVSEVGAAITPGSSGSTGSIAVYKDSEVSQVADKNLLVIGGSCINTVAAKIIDPAATEPICGADFTAKTKVSTQGYIIKSVTSPYNDAKVAVLVAGYEAADTTNAVNKLKEGVSTTVGQETVYPVIGTQ